MEASAEAKRQGFELIGEVCVQSDGNMVYRGRLPWSLLANNGLKKSIYDPNEKERELLMSRDQQGQLVRLRHWVKFPEQIFFHLMFKLAEVQKEEMLQEGRRPPDMPDGVLVVKVPKVPFEEVIGTWA
jgi:hypothetical protein